MPPTGTRRSGPTRMIAGRAPSSRMLGGYGPAPPARMSGQSPWRVSGPLPLPRAEDGSALLGERAEPLGGIGRAHVLRDEGQLELESLSQIHVEPAVDERLDGAV